MISPLLAVTGGGAFLTAWAVISLLVVAVTFVLMLRATYVEWRDGTLW
jgi:hypothetical protein